MFLNSVNFVHYRMAVADMYESYRERECWDVVKAPPQGTVLNIVRAANSDRYNKGRMQEFCDVKVYCFSSHTCHLECSRLQLDCMWLRRMSGDCGCNPCSTLDPHNIDVMHADGQSRPCCSLSRPSSLQPKAIQGS